MQEKTTHLKHNEIKCIYSKRKDNRFKRYTSEKTNKDRTRETKVKGER